MHFWFDMPNDKPGALGTYFYLNFDKVDWTKKRENIQNTDPLINFK